jgi:predicted O-methyltransferase YrrM
MTGDPNWFSCYAEQYFGLCLPRSFLGEDAPRFLQIGAFTGDASLWILRNIPRASLVDVDTWTGSPDEREHAGFDWSDVEATYDVKVAPFADRVTKVKMSSTDYLRSESGLFDFVYIDGDHTAPAVLSDAVLSFPLLKPGGLIAFDDYLWRPGGGGPETRAPRLAVDAFEACNREQIIPVYGGEQSQHWYRKTA